MKYLLLILLVLTLFTNCKYRESSHSTTSDSLLKKDANGTPYSKQTVDSMVRAGAISPDSLPDLPPTQYDERVRIEKEYNKLKVIDTVLIAGADSLHFHSKLYCLKDHKLVVPKYYDLNKEKKDFVTHPFAIDLWLANKADTVLKKQFKATDFNPFFKDAFGGNLKRYGNILDYSLLKKNSDNAQVVLRVSLSIPTTDLGTGVYLTIDKKGEYKISEAN